MTAALAAPPEQWQRMAACLNHQPELWFPAESDDYTRDQAIAICQTCPVITECARHARALRIQHGVWGGRDVEVTGNRKPKANYRPCGTESAYRRHIRNKQTPCEACKEAHAKKHQKQHAAREGRKLCEKVTADQVRAIRAAANEGHSGRSIAKVYGLSIAQVNKIIRRKAWKNV